MSRPSAVSLGSILLCAVVGSKGVAALLRVREAVSIYWVACGRGSPA